jgi:hypothetical protein
VLNEEARSEVMKMTFVNEVIVIAMRTVTAIAETASFEKYLSEVEQAEKCVSLL